MRRVWCAVGTGPGVAWSGSVRTSSQEAFSLVGYLSLGVLAFQAESQGRQGGDVPAQQRVDDGQPDHDGDDAQGAPEDDGGEEEGGVTPPQPYVPGEVGLLAEEDVVGSMQAGRVWVPVADPLLTAIALVERTDQAVEILGGDRLADEGGVPAHLVQHHSYWCCCPAGPPGSPNSPAPYLGCPNGRPVNGCVS